MLEECRDKHPSIQEAVRTLRQRLGGRIAIADYWDADLHAIGIVAPETPGRLAYLSSFGMASGRYDVHLELSAPTDRDLPYEPGEVHEGLDIDGVVTVVAAYLGIGSAEPRGAG